MRERVHTSFVTLTVADGDGVVRITNGILPPVVTQLRILCHIVNAFLQSDLCPDTTRWDRIELLTVFMVDFPNQVDTNLQRRCRKFENDVPNQKHDLGNAER